MSDTTRFHLATEWTGRKHSFTVEVWPTRVEMLAHLTEVHPDGNWAETNEAGETVAGAFINDHGFMSNAAPEHLGTIYLNAEYLDINTTSHEIIHAALFAYECDLIGDYSRARVHMNGTNETVAYLIGNLFSDLVEQLIDHDLYVSGRVAA
jgi:hypothetical protein